MKIKICGITNLEDALLCEKHGADALGFVFYKGSKRYISPEGAGEIISSLSPFIVKVGVFVNESSPVINEISIKTGLDLVQLHGDESNEAISALYRPVIKSFRINESFDYNNLRLFPASYHLLDSYSANDFGGTGQVFDWEKIPKEIRGKIILAGGISIDNIEYAYNKISPAASDLSSSLEEYPGKKDHKKVIQFFNKINKMRYISC